MGAFPCCAPRGRSASAANSFSQSATDGVSVASGCLPTLFETSIVITINRGVGSRPRPAMRRPHRLVAHVADRADQRLVLGAQLGPQPSHVHVDGAGAAEAVIAPYLLKQLPAGEDPAGMLGQVLQQLELLVGQVNRAFPQ